MLYVFTCNDTGSFGIFSLDQVIVACKEAQLLRVNVMGVDYLNFPNEMSELATAEMVCSAARQAKPELLEECFTTFKQLVDACVLNEYRNNATRLCPLRAYGPGAVVAVQLEDSRGEDAN